MLPVEPAFKIFTDRKGEPLENGYVWFGLPDENPITSSVTVYWDAAGTQPAVQPLRTQNGYIVRSGTPANVFFNGTYSQLVQDSKGRQVYYEPNSTNFSQATFLQTVINNLANESDPASGAAMIGRNAQIVDSFAELRTLLKTSPSKYAQVDGPGGEYGDYYLDLADVTTADDGWFTIVAADGGRWKRLRLIWQKTTGGADNPTVQIARNTSHSGGAPGTVVNALNVSTTIGAGVTNFEWAFLSQMDNSAAAGENVAVYGQAKKRGDGSTWAGCFEIQDINTDDPAVGSCIGLELACSANGGDTGFQRNGVHVAMGKLLPGGSTCEWGNGFRATAGADSRFGNAFGNEGSFRLAAFNSSGDASGFPGSATFKDTGKANYGIDLSAATYSSFAIRLAAGQSIAFDNAGSVRLREVGGNLQLEGGGGMVISTGTFQMNNSFAVPSAGNVFGSAGAATGNFLRIFVDGVPFKIELRANA